MRSKVVKTFSTTQMVDKLAKKYGLPPHIKPIGFKHVTALMLERDILIGGEESGGIALSGHPKPANEDHLRDIDSGVRVCTLGQHGQCLK